MKFSSEFTINFGAVDHARVIYYPRFFDYFHRTFEEWFGASLGTTYSRLVVDENLGFPTVTAEAEFVKPVRFGDRLRVELELDDIGRRSITMKYTAMRLPDGEISARARVKKALVNNDTFESLEIPGGLRERLEAFMDRDPE
jgi:4-hydroxybenzoyl-CoA thioesterase